MKALLLITTIVVAPLGDLSAQEDPAVIRGRHIARTWCASLSCRGKNRRESSSHCAAVPRAGFTLSDRNSRRTLGRRYRHRPPDYAGVPARVEPNPRFHRLFEEHSELGRRLFDPIDPPPALDRGLPNDVLERAPGPRARCAASQGGIRAFGQCLRVRSIT